MFDRIADEVVCDKVIVDDYESAINATEHLIKTGCKKIALLSSINDLSVGKLREKGFFKAMASNGLEVDKNLVVLTNNMDDFDEKINDFFIKNKPDGVFALNEHASVTAMKLSIKNGYSIPKDLSLIGFADGLWSRRMTPSMSTVSQHGPEIGEVAAQLLIDKLENNHEQFTTKIIKTELRQRDSTIKLLK
jgi:LacI family transcriptional regulator